MEPTVIIAILACVMLMVFLIGAPLKPLRFIGQGMIKVLIGALFLFFLNAFGTNVGLYIPINLATAAVSGILGIPGILALIAIDMWIL